MRFEAVSTRSSIEQLLPPLLLFLVLLARTGTALVLGCALASVALLYSLVRLGVLAARGFPPGKRRLRSTLTVAFATAVLALSWVQAVPTRLYVDRLARALQTQCTSMTRCPARIGGWTNAPGPTGSDAEMGARVRYPLAYRTDGQQFRLCWVVAFGRCRAATGGVHAAYEPVRPWPWPEAGAALP